MKTLNINKYMSLNYGKIMFMEDNRDPNHYLKTGKWRERITICPAISLYTENEEEIAELEYHHFSTLMN